jgi:hypothetical protein
MGIDFLDLMFRIEKRFKIKLSKTYLSEAVDLTRRDIQAERVYVSVCEHLCGLGRPVPHSAWHGVKLCIAKTVSQSPWKVKRDT